MPREPKITQEDVNSVADRIAATGKTPGARAVRDALGAGSMATVLKHLRIWHSRQEKPETAEIIFPRKLQHILAEFIAQTVASAKTELAIELSTEQQTIGILIAESDRQAETIEYLAGQLKTLETEKAVLAAQLLELATHLKNARQQEDHQRQAAERARTDQATLQVRFEVLPAREAEIVSLREALEVERTARITAERKTAIASARLDKTEAHVNDLQIRLTRSTNAPGAAKRRKKVPARAS